MEETLDILRRCREAGLVQSISNAEHPLCLCNCCECCCVCIRSLKRFEDTVAQASRYIADVAYANPKNAKYSDCSGSDAGRAAGSHAVCFSDFDTLPASF